MPDIENADPQPARRGIAAKTVSLGLSGVALCATAIGALLSGDASSWGMACVFFAFFLELLATPPTVRFIERYQQPVQIAAGVIAIVAAVVVFMTRDGVLGAVLGVSAVLLGVAILVPVGWPASRSRFPRLFGGTQ
jgi:hypothetical protein